MSFLCAKRIAVLLLLAVVFHIASISVGTEEVFAGNPRFADDYSQASLLAAIEASIHYLEKNPALQPRELCSRMVGVRESLDGLILLYKIVKKSKNPHEFNQLFLDAFESCPVGTDGKDAELLVTGYYEPVFKGSLVKKEPFVYPLYRVPADLVRTPSASFPYGRKTTKGIEPYWTRRDIEKNNLLAGYELVYLADPVEAFILHVQGSGRIILQDGSERHAHFAAKNGRPYRSIGRLLADEGKIPLPQVTLPAIKEYLYNHPDEQDRILHHNESFVFFKWADSSPVGAIGQQLIPGRSIAMDHKCYPPGAFFFLETQQPIINGRGEVDAWVPMTRFVFNQDSGSAIKGFKRIDFFWGSGRDEEIAAGLMKHPGRVFFFMKK